MSVRRNHGAWWRYFGPKKRWAQVGELPSKIQRRFEAVVERLRRWPAVSGAKRLRGKLAGRYRLRTGDYRMQFSVKRATRKKNGESITIDEIWIEKVGHRDGFYEE